MKIIRRFFAKQRIHSRYMRCIRCGFSGNFPDSGECPSCGETN